MRRQLDVDLVLTAWLSEGAERAPDRHIVAALTAVAGTRQRPGPGPRSSDAGRWRLIATFAVAVVLLAAVGVGVGIGIGMIRIPPPTTPPPQTEATPRATANSERPDTSDLVTFVDPGGLFDLRLPPNWTSESTESVADDGTRTLKFGAGTGAGTRGNPGLQIVVGGADGHITCPSCEPVRVDSLDDLEAVLVSTPAFYSDGPPERHEDLVLGGEPARSESAGIGNNCLGCPDAYHHVYTIHEGRPIVLAFDYWTVRFRRAGSSDGAEWPFSPATLAEMLDSFRFLDRPLTDDDGAFLAPDGSFAISLPASWQRDDGTDPSALYLTDGAVELSIRSATAGGGVRTCDRPLSFERCTRVSGTTADELAAAIDVVRDAGQPTMWVGPLESTMTLDGEAATVLTMVGSDTSHGGMRPAAVAFVAVIHDGRAYLVRGYRADGDVLRLQSLLEDFTFR